MSLNQPDFIKQASSASTLAGARYIKSHIIGSNDFLQPSNPLRINPFDALKTHFDNIPGKKIKILEAQAYLAASVFLHCMDGWSYLSRAIECLMGGDKSVAVHMAYYAELRASMSFLASEGIGVVNGKNFCIDRTNKIELCSGNRMKTHDFTWDAINLWVNEPSKNNNNLSTYFKVNNKSFADWIQAMVPASPSSIWNTYLKKWIEEWTFDVSKFNDDKQGRNLFSYNPQRIYDTSPIDYRKYITDLSEFWNLLEPGTTSDFNVLDKYLFKKLLSNISKDLLVSRGINKNPEQLAREGASNLGLSLDASLVEILRKSSDHPIFSHSTKLVFDNSNNQINVLSIISRALLMLRVSSGAARHLSVQSNINSIDMKFYWETFGLDNGFWEQGNSPVDLFDLWDDVGDSIYMLNEELKDINGYVNIKTLYEKAGQELVLFKQINRTGLWSIVN